jgi:hypothetical protein
MNRATTFPGPSGSRLASRGRSVIGFVLAGAFAALLVTSQSYGASPTLPLDRLRDGVRFRTELGFDSRPETVKELYAEGSVTLSSRRSPASRELQ